MTADHERKADAALIELAANFKSFQERYDRDREDDVRRAKDASDHTTRWRNGFTERQGQFQEQLNLFKDSIAPVLAVSKFLRWVFIVSGGALLAAMAKWGFAWFTSHFNP